MQGLFLNCVMNSRGIQMSGGLGREMAELMVNKRTNFDMHKYDVKRFHSGLRSDKSWVKSKTQERHVKTYHVPIPWDQPLAERDKIRSVSVSSNLFSVILILSIFISTYRGLH